MTTIDIVRKREQLLARCDAQREYLDGLAQEFAGPLKIADRAVAGVRYLREHPLVLGAAVAVLAVVQRRDLWKWARRGYLAWRAWRALSQADLKSLL